MCEDASIARTDETSLSAPARVLAVVTDMITSGGTESVQLVAVARGAHVSMTTIYKHFGSRDELILAAIAAWMDEHVYRPLAEPAPQVPLFDALMWQFSHVFEPWVENPRMAEAFMRARFGPGGERLGSQGFASVAPVMHRLLEPLDPELADDVMVIMWHVVHAMAVRIAAGEQPLEDILPTIERTLRRVLPDSAMR